MNEIYPGSAGPATSAATRNRNSDTSPPKPTRMAGTFNGMVERLGGLNALAERLEGLADRVEGPEPANADSGRREETRAMPNSVTGRLDVVVEGLDFVRERIATALNRLERFA